MLRRAEISRMNSVRMGVGWCSIARVRTSLNLGSGRMYHLRTEKEAGLNNREKSRRTNIENAHGAEKPNEINADEY